MARRQQYAKNYQNTMRFDKVIVKIEGRNFFASQCICLSQYSTVVLTVVRVMIAKYRKSGISGYRSSLTPEPIELK